MNLNQNFKEFIELLNYHKVEYLVVGGYAVGFYGYPRYTGDIDIWINSTKENSINLANALKGFGFESLGLKPQEFQCPDQIFQLGYSPNRIDILTSVSGLSFGPCFQNKKIQYEKGLPISMIGIDDLKINKTATGRTKDLNDIENLP